METSLVHCLEHCYSCYALVTIRGNELVIFPGIALNGNDKSIVSVDVIISYLKPTHTLMRKLGPYSTVYFNIVYNVGPYF